MTVLGEFLRDCGTRRRKAGEWDCCTFPCEWAIACGHPDPMAEYRGAYASEAEAEALIFSAGPDGGGLQILFRDCMAAAGVPECAGEPQAGDIAVISILGEEAGAVYTGTRWAFAGERGLRLTLLDADCVRAMWRPRNDG